MPHRRAAAAVEHAVGAGRPASLPGELATALRHRAELDDQIAERRDAAAARLRDALLPVGPDAPKTSAELIGWLVENTDDLATRALDGATASARALADAVGCLGETDLPEVGTQSPDRDTFEDTAAHQAVTAPSVTTEQLLACVRKHGIDADDVVDLRRLTGGLSKETLVAGVERAGVRDEIVVRKVTPGRTADTLDGEFAALSFAWRNGITAPEPMWLDHDALGTPAFATRKARGRCLGDVWGPLEAVDPQAAFAAARTLAALHSLDTSTLLATPLPPMTTHKEIVAAVEERQGVLDAVVADPAEPYAALFAVVLAWLRCRAPADVAQPVLVHGDFGLHNLMLDGTELTAVLDWERAHLGHPAEDLAYLRPSIEPVVPWAEFLDAYHGAGGPALDQGRLAYYTVWHDVWRGVSSLRLRTRFLADPARLTEAMVGLLMTPRFLDRAVRNAFPR